jgi:predicted RNA-binding Zn-ribbon protein involved in translation (DUF1610 family)
MSILQNAIDSIAIGLEDYESEDPRRLISATRNIFVGILPLFKHKLLLLSPTGSDEVLLKQRVVPSRNPTGEVTWTGKGRKTVDTQQIKERFETLEIDVDWDRIDEINDYRNEIEHYFSIKTRDSVSKLIADCFLVIRDFIADHLGQDPKVLLGNSSWSRLVQVSEVHAREKNACSETFDPVDWESSTVESALKEYDCPNCGLDLIRVKDPQVSRTENEFVCKSCDAQRDYESIAASALESYGVAVNYRFVKDGGDEEIVQCPDSNNETYIISERPCGICGVTAEHICTLCGNEIPASEIVLGGRCPNKGHHYRTA